MKTIRQILILIIISIFLVSCDKEEDNIGGNHHYLINEGLYPMLFDKGSYWIYKNTEANNIDTIKLIGIEMDTIGPINTGKGYTSTYQVYNLNYSSNILGEYQEQYVGYVISRGSREGGYVYLSSHQIGDSTMNAKITAIHNSMIINGITFKNVVELDIQKDSYQEYDMNLYYVDSIGLIKKEIKEDNIIQRIWELKEHSINYLEKQ